jgi:hypothetical protein
MNLIIVFLLLALPVTIFAATPEEAFQRLVSLQGTWEGKYEKYGMRLTYNVISDGAAVLETMETEGSSMATIYHKYGNKLMATHYCKTKNQPRMVAKVPVGEITQLDFHFLDGTNLGDTHTSDISFRFLNENQFEQTVSFKGCKTSAVVMYTRKK